MQISVFGCPLCRSEKIYKGAPAEEVERVRSESMRGARITTEAVQLHRCSKGHEFLSNYVDGGYALLYERALERLVDGRTRDAVLDAYTALDMFLGWLVLGSAFESRYPVGTPLDQALLEPVREDLKDVLRSSERTIGAALTVAARLKAPPKIPSRLNELRNKAVHAGAYPSDDDAERACLKIEEIVCAFREQLPFTPMELESPFSRFLQAWHIEARRRALGAERPIVTMSSSLMTVLAYDTPPRTRTAKDRIAEYRGGDRPMLID